MLESLNKYSKKGKFSFRPNQNFREVCNAPNDKSGIYIFYGLQGWQKELIYIGRSGKLNKDNSMFVRKAGLGGIRDRIVNGHQFRRIPRRISLPGEMVRNNIESLEIHWFATHDILNNDCPRVLENNLLKEFVKKYDRLPFWNKEL